MEEAQAAKAFILGILSALSLLFGSAAAFFWRPSDRVIAFMMALGGGALLAALALDLVGEALHRGHIYSLCLGCLLGGILFIILDIIVSDYGGFKRKAATTIYHVRGLKHRQYKQILSGIERTDIFKHLQIRHFKQISASIKSYDFKKGQIIYHPGDPADEMHIALSGEVKLFYPEKDQRRTRTVSANQAFGLHAFFTGAPHVSGAAVMSDTAVLQVPRNAFNALLMNSTTLQQVMHRWLRDDKLFTYLLNEHKLSASEAGNWVDTAVHSLMNRGNIPPALAPKRETARFTGIAHTIRRTPVFNALSDDEVSEVGSHLIYVSYEQGQTIFHQGDSADRMFILSEGEVSLIDGRQAVRQPVSLKPCDAFGCQSFFSGAKHSVSAVATRNVKVWVLRKADFLELLRHSQMVSSNLIQFLLHEDMFSYLQEKQHLDNDMAKKFIQDSIKAIEQGQPLPSAGSLLHNHEGHDSAAIAIWLGIMLDGIPESLVIGSSMIHSQVSLSLLVGLFIANFPESLSSSIGMRQQGFSLTRILTMWGSIVIITGIGAALGNMFFTEAQPFVFALIEGVAAGAMLTMIAQTMLPEAYFKGGSIVGFATLLGFLAAILSKAL